MKKYALLLILLIAIALSANPIYYPLTSIAEGFYSLGCVSCIDGLAGMNILDASAHNGELINIRHYLYSGALSNPQSDARAEQYEVYGTPTFILNGKSRIDGGGVEIASGAPYLDAYANYRFIDSPLKMSLTSWQASTGQLSGTIEMISPTLQITNQKKYYVLIEDDVTTEASHLVRAIASENLSLSGAGAINSFSHSFTINPGWVQNKLWVAVFVQLDNNTILQSVSSLVQPTYNLRAAMDWDSRIVVAGNINYSSSPFWMFNLGTAEEYTMQIVVDSAPANWYFNYCDEEGYCFPGSAPIPFSYSSGEAKAFHLNIMTGDSGVALFHFELSSPNMGTYSVPFKMTTDDVSSNDPLLIPAPISLSAGYPNPFAGTVTMRLESSKQIRSASIDIFNLKGQLIESITRENINPGSSEITWTPSASLPSGVYFMKLQGANQAPRKVMFVK